MIRDISSISSARMPSFFETARCRSGDDRISRSVFLNSFSDRPDLFSQSMISRLACSMRSTRSFSLMTILSICFLFSRISWSASRICWVMSPAAFL